MIIFKNKLWREPLRIRKWAKDWNISFRRNKNDIRDSIGWMGFVILWRSIWVYILMQKIPLKMSDFSEERFSETIITVISINIRESHAEAYAYISRLSHRLQALYCKFDLSLWIVSTCWTFQIAGKSTTCQDFCHVFPFCNRFWSHKNIVSFTISILLK